LKPLRGPSINIEELADFGESPTIAVDQQSRDPLPLRQSLECFRQFWFYEWSRIGATNRY
jgi:hypothetical protein